MQSTPGSAIPNSTIFQLIAFLRFLGVGGPGRLLTATSLLLVIKITRVIIKPVLTVGATPKVNFEAPLRI